MNSSSLVINICEICGECNDSHIGWHYGVVTCQACKKFFIRSEKADAYLNFKCQQIGQCTVMLTTRTNCQYCRYKKCKLMGMDMKLTKLELVQAKQSKVDTCQVCSHRATGIHFGVLSCEGCKGFFARSVKDNKHETYKCTLNFACVDLSTCRLCRFRKCLFLGMSYDSCKTGRPSNLVKYQRNVKRDSESSDSSLAASLNKKLKTNDHKMNSANENDLLNINFNHANWISSFNYGFDPFVTNRFLFGYDLTKFASNTSSTYSPSPSVTYNWDYNLTNAFTNLNFNFNKTS